MTTDEKQKILLKRDLFDLPGLRRIKASWTDLVFANHTVRREAKALLFQEMSAAAGLQVPTDQILQRIGRVHGEDVHWPRRLNFKFSRTRFVTINFLFILFLLFFIGVSQVVYLMSSFRMATPEKVARRLAARLHRHVAKGVTLADAMAACKGDYSRAELELVRAGESSGSLSDALRQASNLNKSAGPLDIHMTNFGYPLFVACFVIAVYSFISVFITPKIQDIYSQLSGTWVDVNIGILQSYGLMFMALSVLAFFIVRSMMNGSETAKVMAAFVVLVSLLPLGIAVIYSFVEATGHDETMVFYPVICWIAIITFGLGKILTWMERLVLFIERMALRLLALIPVVGGMERLRGEVAWLATLAYGVKVGMAPHHALQFAGTNAPHVSRRKSLRAASMVEAGHTIGVACLKTSLVRSRIANRLVLEDNKVDYPTALTSLAEEVGIENREVGRRLGVVLELSLNILVGLFVLYITWSIYSAIFGISTLTISRL
jgi:type II secretory pathway component PulF